MTDQQTPQTGFLEKKHWRFGLLVVVLLGYSSTKCASSIIYSSQRQLSLNIGSVDYSCRGNSTGTNCSQLTIDMCLNVSGCVVDEAPNDMEWLLIHIPSTTIYVLIGILMTWNEKNNLIPFASSGMIVLGLSISLIPLASTSAQLVCLECVRMVGVSLAQNFAQSCWLCLIPGKGTSTALATTFAVLGSEAGRLLVVLSPNLQTTCLSLGGLAVVTGVSLIVFLKVTNKDLAEFHTRAMRSSGSHPGTPKESDSADFTTEEVSSQAPEQPQRTISTCEENSNSSEANLETEDPLDEQNLISREKKGIFSWERGTFWRVPVLVAVFGWLLELVGSKTWAALYFNFLTVEMKGNSFAMFSVATTCLIGAPVNLLIGRVLDALILKRKATALTYLVVQSVMRCIKVTLLIFLIMTPNSLAKTALLCAYDSISASYVYGFVVSSCNDMVKIGGLLNNGLVIVSQVLTLFFVVVKLFYQSEIALIVMTAGLPGASALIYVSLVLIRKCCVRN